MTSTKSSRFFFISCKIQRISKKQYNKIKLIFKILPLQTVTFLLLCGVYGALAGRRYIAIPMDGIDVIELSPVAPPTPRIARQTEAYIPIPVPNISQEELKNPRQERSNAHILDYVDFGGQTGSNGAFSWYADYPAHH